MPRIPTDETNLGQLLAGPRRLQPPSDLDGPARQVFVETVTAVAPDHFQVEDAHLVAAYARAVVLERYAADRIAAGAREWVEAHRSSVQSLTTLARALALGTKARRPSRPRAGAVRSQPSAYDVLGLSGGQPWSKS
jgi:hypothetical protein